MKTFSNKVLTKPEAEQALDTAIALVRRNLPLYTDHCQNHSSVHDIYPQCENNQWTCGFWPGEVWLSYERTGDEAFKNTALTLVDSFLYRIEHKIEVDHHDMGFLYSPSCVAAYKLTGSEKGRKAAILAADQLCTRFQEKGEFFQAWGALGAADNYRYIIDCLLNVPLLYWASETTGDAHYADLAHKHVTTCLANSIRPDGSTYHTFFMDPVTGGPVRGATCQGYKDDSCWARGQAWGVYGTAISYRYTKRPEYLDAFRRVLAYYLERLPEDLVPYWDMTFTSGTEEPRDSSSASIVACWRPPSTSAPTKLPSTRSWPPRCWAAWPRTTPSRKARRALVLCAMAPTAKRAPTTPARPRALTSASAGATTSTWKR